MKFKAIFYFGLFFLTFNSVFAQTIDSSAIKIGADTIGNQAASATVYVLFTVEETGKITNVSVDKIKCRKCSSKYKEELKSEAIRVVSEMPDWNPSKEGDKNAQKTNFRVPIKFLHSDE